MNNNAYQTQRRAPNKKLIGGVALACVIVIAAAILYGTCTSIVPTGYTGILTTFGRVADYTLDAGFHLKSPFQKVTLMDNREQKNSFKTEAFITLYKKKQRAGSYSYK